MLNFKVITIFPQMLSSPLNYSILKKAQDKGLIKIDIVDLRDYTSDRHHTTDDSPYGGGQGMVMKPAPVVAAIESARSQAPQARVILLTPRGRVFDQHTAKKLSEEPNVVLICGRYEGVDERVNDALVTDEISIGDYVLSGGEPAAVVLTDAIVRLLPEALGSETSAENDSFSDGLLDCPQYTRPAEFRGMKVPDVLLNGNHAEIEKWRKEKALEKTRRNRPDLLKGENGEM